ncbi:unnamed protein product [Gongylonema pulchrum]|uniref:Tudor domain-containing protein n=1 Tax=Gongylonema pulchrum TaxID=637853 RepID=A0A183D7M9_9BILA|nr:unnamed protein product [Gongylonema pulchrum]
MLTKINHSWDKVNDLGVEEGCPEQRPSNLQEIISRPVAAPTARPLPKQSTGGPSVQPVQSCEPEEQKQFAVCIQPITTFQPHPLVVIKQPRQIDEACKQFAEFKKCQANVKCLPLWAKGMSAMFEFACGSGYDSYLQVSVIGPDYLRIIIFFNSIKNT